jgi:hypothetical protein
MNYPKERQKRSTNYAISTKLVNQFGIEYLEAQWKSLGMYKCAELLNTQTDYYVSPWVIRHLTNKYNWVRTISDPKLAIYQMVKKGLRKPEYYKHAIFTKDDYNDTK